MLEERFHCIIELLSNHASFENPRRAIKIAFSEALTVTERFFHYYGAMRFAYRGPTPLH